MPREDGLTEELIAAVARDHGIAIGRDDPIFTVVALNRRVLGAYLEHTLPAVLESIRTAAERARKDMEAAAEAQRYWLEQETLKDRRGFVDELRRTHESWTEEIQALIERQETQLQRIVLATVRVMQAQRANDEEPPPPANAAPSRPLRGSRLRAPPVHGAGAALMVVVGLAAAIIGAGAAVAALYVLKGSVGAA